MTNQEFDKVKSYSALLVTELHKVIFSESVYWRLKDVLRLAEEMEMVVWGMEKKRQEAASNIVKLHRIA